MVIYDVFQKNSKMTRIQTENLWNHRVKEKRVTAKQHIHMWVFGARMQTMVEAHVCGEIDRDLCNRSCVEIDTYEVLSGVWIQRFLSSLHMRAPHC